MMAEALDRWLREEMEVPPSAVPSPAALRRLCSSPTAPVWDFVIRHVRNQRNVKKIRGNLRWSRHLQEVEAAASPPSRQRALLAARARLRQELRDVTAATAHAQETARRLELSLGAGQSRRWAELRRGAELRLLGAEPRPEGLRGGLRGALQATPTSQSRAELSAILALGAEPEVLVSIKALCTAREAELQQRPRPPRAANHPREAPDWLKQAEAVLIGHSPGAVLWALEALANQSTRALLSGPAPSAEAPPTLRRLLQERWGAVGGVWGALPPLLTRLGHLRGHLGTLLERDRDTDGAARLSLLVAALGAVRSSLLGALRGDQKPQNPAPKSQKFPNSAPKFPKLADLAPKPSLRALRRRLRRGRSQALRLQQRLRFLSAATRGRRAALRPLQEQVVGVARALAPPRLEWAWQRRRELPLAGLGEPRPPRQAPPPLQGLAGQLSSAQGALLSRAAILRLRLRQGALWARRGAWPSRGAWPGKGAGLEPAPPLPEGVAELLAQLRLVGDSCRQRISDWPRLQELVGQWWSQPAQWALATPPGHAPFSHWLQRWRDAAHALQATPTAAQATPTEEKGAGPGEEAPPP
nr:HAUS augmin-like complex subunit 5 isoform X2 [Taeniopygia guttata]